MFDTKASHSTVSTPSVCALQYLSGVSAESESIGVAVSSANVVKPKANFLPLASGEKLDILEMKACPK